MAFQNKRRKKQTDLVSEFMSLPEKDKTMFQSEPNSISQVIEKIWNDWSIGSTHSPEQVISREWSKIVGTKLSSKCAPEKLAPKGILYLKAANAPIKQELSFIKKKIMSRINRLSCGVVIKEVKIL